MQSVTISKCGTVVTMETKFHRTIRKFLGIDKGLYYVARGMNRTEVTILTDRQAEIEFFRWASVLNEIIVMQIYRPGHPKAGKLIGLNDYPMECDLIDEIKTVYEWGKELAELEAEMIPLVSPKMDRMFNIVRMLGDAKLYWPGGPKWWRQL